MISRDIESSLAINHKYDLILCLTFFLLFRTPDRGYLYQHALDIYNLKQFWMGGTIYAWRAFSDQYRPHISAADNLLTIFKTV